MRHIIQKIALIAATLMIMALPALAEEEYGKPVWEPAQQGGKNECLLVAMNCGNQVDSIQQRIDRIQKEINRGTSVYSNDELKTLHDALDEANRTFNELQFSAGS